MRKAPSREDVMVAEDAGEKVSQEAIPSGDYPSTTYPRANKSRPIAKPRAAKKSESGGKGEGVNPQNTDAANS
jgi:hypothetical protein